MAPMVEISKQYVPDFALIPIKVFKRDNEQFALSQRRKLEGENEASIIRLN